ncbi:MAG TPA: hypothetical protein VLF93_06155 [Candidatus Saccharimonadales bacterium]|nr:hypothetical protein [Candidatus Saccharimonadales bacterium]
MSVPSSERGLEIWKSSASILWHSPEANQLGRDPTSIHPQLSYFLNQVSNYNSRVMSIEPDLARDLGASIVEFDMRVPTRGKTSKNGRILRQSRRIVFRYMEGATRKEIAEQEDIPEEDVEGLIKGVIKRVTFAKVEDCPPFTVDELINKFFTQIHKTPPSPVPAYNDGIFEHPEEEAGSSEPEDTALEQVMPKIEEVKIGSIPTTWSDSTGGGRSFYITVADNDTLQHPDWARGTLILMEPEMDALNTLTRFKRRDWVNGIEGWAIGKTTANPYMMRRINAFPSITDMNKDKQSLIDTFAQDVEGLVQHGVVEKREITPNYKSKRPLVEWRLNPSLVFEDKRHEVRRERPMSTSHAEVDFAIKDVQEGICRERYGLITDGELGFGPELREEFSSIFASGILEEIPGDHPFGRMRARDVLFIFCQSSGITIYRRGASSSSPFLDESIRLVEADTNEVVTHAETDIKERPQYPRVMIDEYPYVKEWLELLTHCIPREERKPNGTASVDLFRTFRTVVEKKHKDFGPKEQGYVAIRVNDIIGNGGARTRLFGKVRDLVDKGEDLNRPRYSRQIQIGETLIFSDSDFYHDVTPIVPDSEGNSQRDAAIATILFNREE